MRTQKISCQKQMDSYTGQIYDMRSLEKSKRKPPVFPDFVQIPPTGARILANLPVRPQAISALHACMSQISWNNIFLMTPMDLESLTGIGRTNYSVVIKQLIQVGAILRLSPDPNCFEYWMNPQLAWKGKSEYFWTVDAKFKHLVLAESALVPGGAQLLISINTVEKYKP